MCEFWWWAIIIIMLMTSLAGKSQPLEEIRAAVILPEDPMYVISLPRVLPVLELAASRVSHLLPGRVIHFIPTDDNCTADYALKNAVMVKMCPGESKKLHVIFGPSCEYAVALVGRLMKFWQTPLLTTGALTYDFTNPKTAKDSEFHLLVRLGHLSFKPMSEFIVSILQSYNWSKLLLVYEKDGGKLLSGRNTCKLMMETLVGVLKNHGILYSAYDLEKDGGIPKAEYLSREMNNHYSS